MDEKGLPGPNGVAGVLTGPAKRIGEPSEAASGLACLL
jgi:hypothetical protein